MLFLYRFPTVAPFWGEKVSLFSVFPYEYPILMLLDGFPWLMSCMYVVYETGLGGRLRYMSWLEWKGIIAIQMVVSRGLAGERSKRIQQENMYSTSTLYSCSSCCFCRVPCKSSINLGILEWGLFQKYSDTDHTTSTWLSGRRKRAESVRYCIEAQCTTVIGSAMSVVERNVLDWCLRQLSMEIANKSGTHEE